MSGATTITIGALATDTVTMSATYDVSVGAGSTFNIEGIPGSPIAVTVAETGVLGLGLLTTTNISNADEVVTALANISAGSAFNIGENASGTAIGNGTLELGPTIGVNALDAINFDGTGNTLILDHGLNVNLLDSVNGFATGDQIELQGVTATSATFAQNSGLLGGAAPGGTVTLYDGTTSVGSISLSNGTYAANAFTVTEVNGNAELTVCFLEGTRLLGLHGDIAVEDMEPGDRLITHSGAMRPVKWVGRRLIDASRHPRPDTVWPIRIEAGAIDHGLPERPLYLSPDHALYLDGCLIPAKALVNGRSIIQEKRDRIMYYHVELESHDILLAEALPVESYLETGNRNFFENGGGAMVLHPSMAQAAREATGCAPFVETGDIVTRVRTRLQDRLHALNRSVDCRLRAVTCRGDATVTVVDQFNYRIDLDGADGDLVLLSNAVVPAECDPASRDRRRLGIDVAAIEVETASGNRVIRLDDARLRSGWHSAEFSHRWTNGEATVPAALLEGAYAVSIRLHGLASYMNDAHAQREAGRIADAVMNRQIVALGRLGIFE